MHKVTQNSSFFQLQSGSRGHLPLPSPGIKTLNAIETTLNQLLWTNLYKLAFLKCFALCLSLVSQVVLNRICAKAISDNSATERFAESKTNQPVLNCNLSPTGADPSFCACARQNSHHHTTEEVHSGRWLNKILFAPCRRFATTSSGRNTQDTQLWLKTRKKPSVNVDGILN